ncbi:unnamed protein product [Lactuca saligna]|uniref:F-box domain-containing protein n=1 Tax=Lactuca saligna TaxID=75948 RepID=A0AA36EDV4_LACSI|nr:unnamed protein product [Lactuca saligna]
MSRLPTTNDAITTGKVSKRWKHLWTLVPTLIFERYNDNHLWPDLIDKTLTQCHQLKLKRFEVYTSMIFDLNHKSNVGFVNRYAVRRNVEKLNLRLWNLECEVEFPLDQYFFMSSCFAELTLEGCILNPIEAISWRNFKSLSIYKGKLDENLIENILCQMIL